MTMRCDIYKQKNIQSDSGAISREWVYSQTLDCRIEPMKTGGALGRGDNKIFESTGNDEYNERLQLKMHSLIPLSKRWRVTNIRSNKNEKLFFEIDRLDHPDTIFEVTANHAELDPFGRISYYEITLLRIPVQNNDQISL